MSGLGTPFLDWLRANGINPDHTPMWPELDIDEAAKTIRIEMLWGDGVDPEDGLTRWQRLGKAIGTVLREFPLIEPMSADLATAWALNSEPERHAMRLRAMFQGLPPGSAPQILVTGPGKKLVFIMPLMSSDELTQTMTGIAGLMPGVNVSVISGATAVVAVDQTRQRTYRGDV